MPDGGVELVTGLGLGQLGLGLGQLGLGLGQLGLGLGQLGLGLVWVADYRTVIHWGVFPERPVGVQEQVPELAVVKHTQSRVYAPLALALEVAPNACETGAFFSVATGVGPQVAVLVVRSTVQP